MGTEGFKGALLSALVIASLAVSAISLLSVSPSSAAPEGLTPRAPIYIDGDAGFTFENGVNGGGLGTRNDPYIIENWVISAENGYGIEIRNTTAHFIIRNCRVENGVYNHYGIYLYGVMNGKIENNTCENNSHGIDLYRSSNNTLSNNTCRKNYYGIHLFNSVDNNTLDNNTCENNDYGIWISDSDNNVITNNTIEKNIILGIQLYYISANNYIRHNTIEKNDMGIRLIDRSNNNHIYHNNIINNSTQAWDDGSNYWDNGYPSGGNYWSDGIGDTPYDIAGGSNQDRYPLMNPWPPAAWRLIETWIGTVQAPSPWRLIEAWSGAIEAPAQWQPIETWTGAIRMAGWNLIESWTSIIGAPVYPSKPTLKSPADGTITNDNMLTFEWDVGLNANNHRLLVGSGSDFASPIENRLFGPTDNTYAPMLENSLPDDNYSWKVVAINALGENQSSIWTFVIDTVPPEAPSLISPDNGTITNDNTPTFDWPDVTGAENYDLLVDSNPDFSSPEIQVTVSVSTYTTAELPNDNYSWKVRARDAAGNVSDWSSTRTLLIMVTRGVDVFISPSYQSGLPGATLGYTVMVKNEGNISDTYALTATDSAGWGPTLSKDSLELAPKAYDTVTLTVTIPTDALLGVQDTITITAKSNQDPTVSDSAICTAQTVAQRRVGVSISPGSRSWPPGETLTYTVTIVNNGTVEDTYDLKITDALAWGATVSPTSLTIAAGGSDTASVGITIPEGTAGGVEDEITVKGTSRTDLTVSDSATCIASAAAVSVVKVSISPESKSGPPGEKLTYEVTVKNEGNAGDTYFLSTAGAPDWSPRVENTSLTLYAGEVGKTTLIVTIPTDASEGTSITFNVGATSVGDPTVTGFYTCGITVTRAPVELAIPLAISAFLIGAAILTIVYLLRVRPKRVARRRVLRSDIEFGFRLSGAR